MLFVNVSIIDNNGIEIFFLFYLLKLCWFMLLLLVNLMNYLMIFKFYLECLIRFLVVLLLVLILYLVFFI